MPETTLSHSKDTYIIAGNPTTNYGTSSIMKVTDYSSSPTRPIMSVSLSTIPKSAVIKSAYHYIKMMSADISTGNQTYTLTLIREGRHDWVENQATWNIYKTGSNWGTAGCSNTTTDIDTTYTSSKDIDPVVPDPSFPTVITPIWGIWDVTNIIKYIHKQGLDYAVRMHSNITAASWPQFASKEAAAGNQPYLTINWRHQGGLLTLI